MSVRETGSKEESRKKAFSAEHKRIENRRRDLKLLVQSGDDANAMAYWALAFSGGGIRSATFCLGVLQTMAKEDFSTFSDVDVDTDIPEVNRRKRSLLERFDYFSTVSGGSYIGAFFGSLFKPGRLTCSEGEAASVAAIRAYRTLSNDPPGRIYPSEPRDEHGSKAIAWLRENGRYLTPTGGGDLTYAIAVLVRNWLATLFVICSTLLFVLAALALLRYGALFVSFRGQMPFHDISVKLLTDAIGAVHGSGYTLWWSELWLLPIIPLFAFALPYCIAHWLVYSTRDSGHDLAHIRTAMWVCTFLIFAALAGSAYCLFHEQGGPKILPWVWTVCGAVLFLGVTYARLSARGGITVTAFRVRMTRKLNSAILWTLVFAAIAFGDTVSQTLYLHVTQSPTNPYVLTIPPFLAALVSAAITYGAKALDGKSVPAFAKRLPISALAAIPAMILALLIFVSMDGLLLLLRWDGAIPNARALQEAASQAFFTNPPARILGSVMAIAFLFTFISGRFAGFLNLSSLEGLYASRLARAYLGATNGLRFPSKVDLNEQGETSAEVRRRASVAEPIPGDDLTLNQYFDPASIAPVHLINATMNLTLDPSDQLVQRDRKGQSLCVAPTIPANGEAGKIDSNAQFFVDGELVTQPHVDSPRNEIEQSRRLSDWVAISGAAVSTGLGRTTSLSTSLMLGLANVRLGSWWAGAPMPARKIDVPFGQRMLLFAARTQTHLAWELFSRFYGMRRDWQYLSDGGHFENMGVYELLRVERNVKLIVACDCGEDEKYTFDDLANLTRLARIDFKVEVEVDTEILKDSVLNQVFGTPTDFTRPDAPRGLCAILFNVYRPAEPRSGEQCLAARIVLLKPRLIDTAPQDLVQYRSMSPSFPNESTADQFFNQAQWESYRKLGLCVATRVFGSSSRGGVGCELAKYLFPSIAEGAPGCRSEPRAGSRLAETNAVS